MFLGIFRYLIAICERSLKTETEQIHTFLSISEEERFYYWKTIQENKHRFEIIVMPLKKNNPQMLQVFFKAALFSLTRRNSNKLSTI